MNTSLPNWADADSLGSTLHTQQPLLSAAEPAGPSKAWREAGRRFSQGLVNSWLGYKLRCSFNQILSVLGEKKKKELISNSL